MISFEVLGFLHLVSLLTAAGALALLVWHYFRSRGKSD